VDWSLFPRGLLIGFSVALPVGPMAVLCIRRTLAHGWWTGLISGLGIALADALFGSIAAFGLTSISAVLIDFQDIVRVVGGLFLCYLGVRTFRTPAASVAAATASRSNRQIGAFLSTLGLTLTNPTTILSFAAIFSGFGVMEGNKGTASAFALVAGVFLGSTLWWVLLTGGTSLLRGKLTTERLTIVNRISGAVILIFGLVALASLLE
jgi:threonine/homoserine/homoserine lactone efflux protein